MTLEVYNAKRDFAQTREPHGDAVHNGKRSTELRFVVQEHHASRLHYDFRLEWDGVLKSWAVPKGPPADTTERRLAIETEDHPLEYIDFSGSIPAGNYGAGEVSIWDSGAYDVIGDPLDVAVSKGKIELALFGGRLNGKYDFIRINDEKREWLFIKSIQPIPRELIKPAPKKSVPTAPAPGVLAPMPSTGSVGCMLAVPGDRPFSDPDWLFEIKWDGYRALLYVDGKISRLVSRNKQPFDDKFPELKNLGDYLNCEHTVIDGEIVALTPDGKPHFQSLQNRSGFHRDFKSNGSHYQSVQAASIVFMAFDILYLDGHDVSGLPLTERLELLSSAIMPASPIKFSDHIRGDGIALFEHIQELGMEGVMAKRANSPYVQDRSPSWVKIKAHRSMDVVIAGYTESKAVHRPFASLLIGAYSGTDLVPLGHVGTGFTDETLGSLSKTMSPLETDGIPYASAPKVNGKPHWLRPELVCEVTYSEITGDGQLRHPVFMGLRTDKPAKDCRLSDEAPANNGNAAAKAKLATRRAQSELSDPPEELMKLIGPDATIAEGFVVVEGHSIKLSNLKKQYWPSAGTSKRDLLRYYATVAPVMLAHLVGRPVVVQRYPDGVAGQSFYQHDAGAKVPDFLQTVDIDESSGPVRYAVVDSLASLLYLVNLGSIPIHTWNCRTANLKCPDRIVFDLDPGDDFSAAVKIAHGLRELLNEVGLDSYLKTSGVAGLHICFTIHPDFKSDDVVAFARAVGQIMRQRLPDIVTTERRIKNRGASQVYLDCLQNGMGKTVVTPYSVRPQPTPTVSTPLQWDELTPNLDQSQFTIDTVLTRVREKGDIFGCMADKPQCLKEATGKVAKMTSPARRKDTREQ